MAPTPPPSKLEYDDGEEQDTEEQEQETKDDQPEDDTSKEVDVGVVAAIKPMASSERAGFKLESNIWGQAVMELLSS